MWSTTSILLLVSIIGTSFAYIPDDPEFTSRLFSFDNGIGSHKDHVFHLNFGSSALQDDARTVVEKFIARIIRSVASKDVAVIKGLFQPGFVFKGCKGTYTKEQVVGMLTQLPCGAKFEFSLETVTEIGASIKYTVTITGFGASAIGAEFVLNNNDQQLESGNIPACQKSPFGFALQDDARTVVEKFIARIIRSVASKDVAVIKGLFQPGFVFKGCKGIYTKEQVVGMLAQAPSGAKLEFTLKTATDIGASIKYTVSITGFGSAALDAEFVLNKNDQQLESGNVPACQKKAFFDEPTVWHLVVGRSFSARPEDSDVVINRFLTAMKPIVTSRDPIKIGELFDSNFVYKGCRGTYNKDESVEKITSIPAQASLEFSLKSSHWNNFGQIEYTVDVSVPMMNRMEAQFVYCPYKNQLKSGNTSKGCPVSRFY